MKNSLAIKMVLIPSGDFLRGSEFKGSWQDYHDQVLAAGRGELVLSEAKLSPPDTGIGLVLQGCGENPQDSGPSVEPVPSWPRVFSPQQ